jgi:hypothetical protein
MSQSTCLHDGVRWQVDIFNSQASIYDRAKTESYAAFANAIVASLQESAGDHHWKIEFIGKYVNFNFDGEATGLYPSLWMWFFAAARDSFEALASRERLIGAIDAAIALPATVRPFSLEPS